MTQALWSAWRWWIAPAALSLALALLYLDPFIGDWDALDYTILSLRGEPSSMALGRSLFIFTNHGMWRAAHALFGLRAEDAYLLFKSAIVLMSVLTVISCWALAREVTESERTATVASLLVALSPAFIIYSGQVMTEIPSLLLLSVALTLYLRGARERRAWMMILGAAVLGADVNVRETMGFYGPLLLLAPLAYGWRPGLREGMTVALAVIVFLLCAFVPFAFWFWTDAGGFRSAWYGWRVTMQEEAARHPLGLYNLLPFLLFFLVTSLPVALALPFAFLREWRERRLSPLLVLAATGLFSNLLLILNYSTVINWRYFLTGLPALAPLAASFFMRVATARFSNPRRAFLRVLALLSLMLPVTLPPLYLVRERFAEKHALMKSYRERLAPLPRDAVVIAGGQTVGVNYWRGIGLGEWETIGTGAGWPGTERLVPLIETYLKAGRRVFLDADARLWSPCRWQQEETREIVGLQTRFRFRRVSATVFEIRPVDDTSAQDVPALNSLLPENRAGELKYCGPNG